MLHFIHTYLALGSLDKKATLSKTSFHSILYIFSRYLVQYLANIRYIVCQIYATMFVSKYLVRYLSAGWLVSCSNITSPFPLRPADNKGRLRSSKEKLIERLLPDTNLVYLKLSQFTPEIQHRNLVYRKLS